MDYLGIRTSGNQFTIVLYCWLGGVKPSHIGLIISLSYSSIV